MAKGALPPAAKGYIPAFSVTRRSSSLRRSVATRTLIRRSAAPGTPTSTTTGTPPCPLR
ncbi:hypothetical protein PR202_ga28344 [Eleusine coracana subsp. coracana]|uniref:Uncharacterized protein n=1 Tax=Eleusine coracana subsp. coracana TaxID=191504 RepID=A0AAV5DIF7_ELECO|nr:hypothetical protein PR202_ga28344 [Eleusine coracana subsp. coracana]